MEAKIQWVLCLLIIQLFMKLQNFWPDISYATLLTDRKMPIIIFTINSVKIEIQKKI